MTTKEFDQNATKLEVADFTWQTARDAWVKAQIKYLETGKVVSKEIKQAIMQALEMGVALESVHHKCDNDLIKKQVKAFNRKSSDVDFN